MSLTIHRSRSSAVRTAVINLPDEELAHFLGEVMEKRLQEAASFWIALNGPMVTGGTSSNEFLYAAEAAWFAAGGTFEEPS